MAGVTNVSNLYAGQAQIVSRLGRIGRRLVLSGAAF
jgi:hypothetical protein